PHGCNLPVASSSEPIQPKDRTQTRILVVVNYTRSSTAVSGYFANFQKNKSSCCPVARISGVGRVGWADFVVGADGREFGEVLSRCWRRWTGSVGSCRLGRRRDPDGPPGRRDPPRLGPARRRGVPADGSEPRLPEKFELPALRWCPRLAWF